MQKAQQCELLEFCSFCILTLRILYSWQLPHPLPPWLSSGAKQKLHINLLRGFPYLFTKKVGVKAELESWSWAFVRCSAGDKSKIQAPGSVKAGGRGVQASSQGLLLVRTGLGLLGLTSGGIQDSSPRPTAERLSQHL